MWDDYLDSKKYKIFDQDIHVINRNFITPSNDDVQKYKNKFQDFFDCFLKVLRENDKILDSYHKIQYTGSNYDGLVVGTYKEFDMDILIKLPSTCIKVNLPIDGTIKIKLDDITTLSQDKRKILEKWINPGDSKKYIVLDKFRSWIEGVIDNTLNTLDTISKKWRLKGNDGYYLLKMKKSGPAFTFEVECCDSEIKFDVDFVFCLYFEEWPQGFPNVHKNGHVKQWVAVPKTPNEHLNKKYKDYQEWRYSFPEAEKILLNGNNHLKSTIKLIKKIRDVQEMNYLPSYYIKTLFLWKLKNESSDFWNSSIGFLFVTMLKELRDAVENQKLPFYWDSKLNLFNSELYITKNQLDNCKIKLNIALTKIELYCLLDCPDSIRKLLLTQKECEKLQDYVDHSNTDHNDSDYVDTHNSLQTFSLGDSGWGLVGAIGLTAAVVGGLYIINRNRNNQN